MIQFKLDIKSLTKMQKLHSKFVTAATKDTSSRGQGQSASHGALLCTMETKGRRRGTGMFHRAHLVIPLAQE